MGATYHMFTGDDDQSHIEIMDLGVTENIESEQCATSIRFVKWPPGHFIDWHPAPRRQYIFLIAGKLEIGLSNGEKWQFEPGDAWLVEDTHGEGHTTQVVSNTAHLMGVIALKN